MKVIFPHFIDERMKHEDIQPVWEDAVPTPSVPSPVLFPLHPLADFRLLHTRQKENKISES